MKPADWRLFLERSADYDFSASNEELLELCKRQDQDALRVLFRRHERPVYSLLMRMLSNREDAEEALAEVFVKVWRAAGSFKGDAKFTTWLYRITSNTARDRLRSRQVRQEVFMDDTIVDEANLGEPCSQTLGNPEKCALVADEKARLLRAMQELSEDDRLLITLYHFQECEYEEISSVTGISPANLKVRLFRARQRLRKLCADAEREDGSDEVRFDTAGTSGLQQRSAETV